MNATPRPPPALPTLRSWGYLSRAGLNDKSQLNRQIEKYADIYTSRVSNFLRYTPYSYFRCVCSLRCVVTTPCE